MASLTQILDFASRNHADIRAGSGVMKMLDTLPIDRSDAPPPLNGVTLSEFEHLPPQTAIVVSRISGPLDDRILGIFTVEHNFTD